MTKQTGWVLRSSHALLQNELAQAQERIVALEGVVGVAKKWCDLEAAWQVHSGNCKKCSGGEMCSEEWEDKLFAVGNAWMNMFGILAKLEEV